jgi:hypothetical protein
MRSINAFLLLLLLGSVLWAASSDKPPILFVCTHENYAWGSFHTCTFIDSSGAVRFFDFIAGEMAGPNARSAPPPGSEIVSVSEYETLIKKGAPTGTTINRDTLLLMQALIEPAGKGTLSFGYVCKDAGIYCLSAYSSYTPSFPIPSEGSVKEVICFQAGDEYVCNSSPEAKAIARWLRKTIDSSSYCYAPDSCLYGLTVVSPVRQQVLPALSPSPTWRIFDLTGKKIDGHARQMVVGKKERMLSGFHKAQRRE